MADDDRLLHLLEQALAQAPVDPPEEGVAAVRRRAGGGSPPAGGPRPAPVPVGDRSGLERASGRRWHRAGWAAAGVSVAAAVLVVAFLVAPTLMARAHSHDSTSAATRIAAARLRVALASEDPVAVARADRELVHQARQEPKSLPDDAAAVAVHSEALAFLRDHPTPDALSAVASPPPTTAGNGAKAVPTTTATPGVTPTVSVPVSTDLGGPSPAVTSPSSTLAPAGRTVSILAVRPVLDGTFRVDFSVAGFTPDLSGRPGTWSIRFSFDSGQGPTLWAGGSPWTFPQADGIRYHRVCAHVADANGVEDPGSGGCRDIL